MSEKNVLNTITKDSVRNVDVREDSSVNKTNISPISVVEGNNYASSYGSTNSSLDVIAKTNSGGFQQSYGGYQLNYGGSGYQPSYGGYYGGYPNYGAYTNYYPNYGYPNYGYLNHNDYASHPYPDVTYPYGNQPYCNETHNSYGGNYPFSAYEVAFNVQESLPHINALESSHVYNPFQSSETISNDFQSSQVTSNPLRDEDGVSEEDLSRNAVQSTLVEKSDLNGNLVHPDTLVEKSDLNDNLVHPDTLVEKIESDETLHSKLTSAVLCAKLVKEELTKRTIKWIPSGKTFTVPSEIWNKVYINNTIDKEAYTYNKNRIGEIFDKEWKCILILTRKNDGSNVISLSGPCKHKECRQYKLTCRKSNLVQGQGATFDVSYSKLEVTHGTALTRQLRGSSRAEAKDNLSRMKPATFQTEQLISMDENLYEDGNSGDVKSDEVTRKARSEYLQSQDYAKDDYNDMIGLQEAINNAGEEQYIQKVISPFAVYIHSMTQYKVLETLHKRKTENEEVVGRLDATGGVAQVTPETSTYPILYYPLLTQIKGDKDDKNCVGFPATQCINSAHKVPDIAGWLFDFKEAFMQHNQTISPIFHRIISDFSYANIHGVLHAFQGMHIQQYLFACYRFAVSLTDFEELLKIVKVQLCITHLSNTIADFSKKYYAVERVVKTKEKTTTIQQYVIEAFCSMMSCKSYNVLKEIFRNVCILVLSTFETNEVLDAKENLVELCTTDILLTVTDELKTKYKYDRLMQSDMDRISECNTIYDYNESILKLPIYRGSLFHRDLRHIYDSFEPQIDQEEEEIPKNNFYNAEILEAFMKQFGGILPLWTGITIPKGIDRYHNQPAESHMNVTKRLLDEKAIQIGSTGNVKPSRFAKLMRRHVIGAAKRYLLTVPRHRLNYGKTKDKDNSKVKKKIALHMKTKVAQRKCKSNLLELVLGSSEDLVNLSSSSEDLVNVSPSSENLVNLSPSSENLVNLSPSSEEFVNLSSSSSRTHESPSSSLKHAQECWNKKKKKNKFSYFQKKSILSRAAPKEPSTPKIKKPLKRLAKKKANNPKGKNADQILLRITPKDSSTPKLKKPAEEGKKCYKPQMKVMRFRNGLVKNVNHYIQAQNTYCYVVARIGDQKLTISDYKSLLPGNDLSIGCMNYIIEFILPPKYINLTLFANNIMADEHRFDFSILNKICFMPWYENDKWVLYIMNTKDSKYCYISTSESSSNDEDKFGFFSNFISSYNSGNHKNKLKNIEYWKEECFEISKPKQKFDSGINIIDYVYQFATSRQLKKNPKFDVSKYREKVLLEALKFSDDMESICLKCGEVNDDSTTETINWQICVVCERWIHQLCLNEPFEKCPLCEHSN